MNAPLSLPVKMNTAAALQMVEDLRKIDGDFDLDASQSTSIGALCLQALVAASRTAKASGVAFRLTGVSEALETQMSVMGVTPKDLVESVI